MEANKERKLKIAPKHFPRVWKDAVFPEIRLAGKWLQDNGFFCGKSVSVIATKGKLVIEIIPEAPPNLQVIKKSVGRRSARIISLHKEGDSQTIGA